MDFIKSVKDDVFIFISEFIGLIASMILIIISFEEGECECI